MSQSLCLHALIWLRFLESSIQVTFLAFFAESAGHSATSGTDFKNILFTCKRNPAQYIFPDMRKMIENRPARPLCNNSVPLIFPGNCVLSPASHPQLHHLYTNLCPDIVYHPELPVRLFSIIPLRTEFLLLNSYHKILRYSALRSP